MGEGLRLVERMYELVDRNDLEGVLGLFTPDAEFTFPGAALRGREQMAAFLSGMWAAFPEHRHTIRSVVETDGAVVVEAETTAVHTGPLVTPSGEVPATGRTTTTALCQVLVIEAGLIASSHIWFDQLELLSQLGLAPVAA